MSISVDFYDGETLKDTKKKQQNIHVKRLSNP